MLHKGWLREADLCNHHWDLVVVVVFKEQCVQFPRALVLFSRKHDYTNKTAEQEKGSFFPAAG